LGDSHPDYASGLLNLGLLYQDHHQLSKALAAYQEALEIHRAKLGPLNIQVGKDLINLGSAFWMMHRKAEAEGAFEEALQTERLRGGVPTSVTGFAEANLGILAASRRNYAAAQKLLRDGTENLARTTSAEDPRLIPILDTYAAVLKTTSSFAKAEEVQVKSTRIRVRMAIVNDANRWPH
jgi:tetratricopeptide (TPR) repeat protein